MQDWMQVYWADNFEPFLSSGNPFLHLVVHLSSHCFLNSGSAFRFSKSGLGGLGEQFERQAAAQPFRALRLSSSSPGYNSVLHLLMQYSSQ